jgi:hypothetical protein
LSQLASKLVEPLGLRLGVAALKDDILSFHITEVTQSLPQTVIACSRSGRTRLKNADPWNFVCLLRLGGTQSAKSMTKISQNILSTGTLVIVEEWF